MMGETVNKRFAPTSKYYRLMELAKIVKFTAENRVMAEAVVPIFAQIDKDYSRMVNVKLASQKQRLPVTVKIVNLMSVIQGSS